MAGFSGMISDVGGPTANMYKMTCKDEGGTSTSNNDVAYGPDWYTNVSKGKTKEGDVSSKVNAKRIGECPK